VYNGAVKTALHLITSIVALACLASACPGDSPSDEILCNFDTECPIGETCQGGICLPEESTSVDGGAAVDSGAPDAGSAPDANQPEDSGAPNDAGGLSDASVASDSGRAVDSGTFFDAAVAPDGGGMDSGPGDAGSNDAGHMDSGSMDSGPIDSGSVDPGPIDSGPVDAGAADSGSVDSGFLDSGTPDSGTPDAGCVANMGAHDEDGDGVPDVCDNCPATPNPLQEDLDEADNGRMPDGVGDACDPRPALSGDHILLFEPFTGNTVPNAWQASGGTWSVSGDALHQTNVNASTQRLEHSATFQEDVALEMHFRLEAFGGYPRNFGAFGRFDQSTDDGWFCALAEFDWGDDGGTLLQPATTLWELDGGAAVTATNENSANPADFLGQDHTLKFKLEGDEFRCQVNDTTITKTGVWSATGGIGFRTNRVEAQVSSVVVYGLGP
jgi:hypothetical protein